MLTVRGTARGSLQSVSRAAPRASNIADSPSSHRVTHHGCRRLFAPLGVGNSEAQATALGEPARHARVPPIARAGERARWITSPCRRGAMRAAHRPAAILSLFRPNRAAGGSADCPRNAAIRNTGTSRPILDSSEGDQDWTLEHLCGQGASGLSAPQRPAPPTI